MKRISIFCIIMLLLTLCGCRKELTSDKTLIAGGSSIKAEHTEESKPIEEETEQPQEDNSNEMIISGIEDVSGIALSSFDLSDYPNLDSRISSNFSYMDISPQTAEEIMNAVGTTGLIVTGYAYGTRVNAGLEETKTICTKTKFLIDHVFYGDALAGETIIIGEDYELRNNDNDEVFLYSISRNYSFLQDNEYVLLVLEAYPEISDCYFPTQRALPIGEDCTEWSESYMTSLLDYFRGDKSVYAHPEDYSYTKTFQFKNGKTEELPVYVTAQIWPQKNLSDAEMIAEMQDNLLVYLASEYKIKIWPTEHVNYSGTHCARTVSNMAKWQYP